MRYSGEDEDLDWERDSATDDTRVKTAVSWLEDAVLLIREENYVQIFPSSLRVKSLQEAQAKLRGDKANDTYRVKLLSIVRALLESDPDEGISTDELMMVSGLSAEEVRKALADLEEVGIANNDTVSDRLCSQGSAARLGASVQAGFGPGGRSHRAAARNRAGHGSWRLDPAVSARNHTTPEG